MNLNIQKSFFSLACYILASQLAILCAQPTANFTYSTTSCAPTSIQFTDTSIGDISNYSWVIEDSPVSTETNPSFTFSIAGSYQVCLEVQDSKGNTNEYCESITLLAAPEAQFEASATSSCSPPMTVVFSPSITANADWDFMWLFGDGEFSDAASPIHTYNSTGQFDVTLIVTDRLTACSDTLTQERFIQIGSSITSFNSQIIFNGDCSNTQVDFSIPNATDVASVNWDFGDGATSTLLNPTHLYEQAGCFTPSLEITTTNGCTATFSATNCILSNGLAPISYTTQGALVACVPDLEVAFFANAPNALAFEWNFGGAGTSTENNPIFTFTEYGTFPISMTAWYADGCVTSVVDTTVVIEPLALSFEADMTSGCAGVALTFENTSTIPYPIASLEWDFEFATSKSPNPTIVFNEADTYGVSLSILTENGCTQELTLEDYIHIGEASNANFSADIYETCGDTPVSFTNNSSDNATEFLWDFGDGTTSMLENPIHFFVDTGYMDITLIAGNNGCLDTATIEGFIQVIPPIANFDAITDCHSNTVQFNNTSLSGDTYFWTFGDGNTSTEANPSHTYTSFGDFTVKLVVNTANSNCEDDIKKTITISNPIADFSLDYTDGGTLCTNDSIKIRDTSIDALSYEWLYDTNNVVLEVDTSFGYQATFVFPYAGTYTDFGLVITNEQGCTDSLLLEDLVEVNELVASFESEHLTACYPIEVQYASTVTSSQGEILSYFWDFGDGTNSTEMNPVHSFTQSGNFEVRLTIKNSVGCNTTVAQTSEIIASDVDPSFSVQQDDCARIELSLLNTTASNEATNYVWDFGDGMVSTDANPNHVFSASGNYTVCLTATNGACERNYCEDLLVSIPLAAFSADTLSTACLDNSFDVQYTDASEGVLSWEWDFGDESGISTEDSPAYTYTESGNYTVCLVAGNQFGCTDTLCRKNYIQVGGPSASVAVAVAEDCTGTQVSFDITTSDVVTYNLDFGNGETLEGEGDLSASNPIDYAYTTSGSFVPVLTIADSSNCILSYDAPSIEVTETSFDFSQTTTSFCEGDALPIDFFLIAQNTAEITSIQWLFPGSNTPQSTALNPSDIVYSNAGSYTVTMLIQTPTCEGQIVKEDLVVIEALPNTNFEIASNSICANELSSFKNNTIETDSSFTYEWAINETFIDSSIDFDYTFENPGTYVISLESTNSNGCSNIQYDTIFILQGVTLDLEEEVLLCQNESLLMTPYISAPNEVLYQWSPTTGLDCEYCLEATASPESTTTYYLNALTSDGCTATDSIQVMVSATPPPSINLSADTTVCFGESVQLNVTSDQSMTTILWDTNSEGLTCYEDCPNPLASPNTNTNYYVQVSNPEGCSSTDSVAIAVLTNDAPILGEDIAICEGMSASLEVLSGNNPVWENHPSLSCSNCPNPEVSPNTSTTYIVQIETDEACLIQDTISVEVTETIPVIAGQNQAICLGDSIVLEAAYPGDVIWTSGGNVIASNETAVTVFPTENAVYTLNVFNNNCPSTDALEVEVFESSEIWTTDYSICEGETVALSVDGLATDFQWLSAPGLSVTSPESASVNPTETTVYTVIGTAATCPPDTAQISVEVLENPAISTNAVIPFTNTNPTTIQVNVAGSDTFTYQWSPDASLSCLDCPNPIASPDSTSVYTLTVVNETTGCSSNTSIQLQQIINCTEESIVTPSAFTPNQDGENDIFYIRGSAQVKVFRVFNRWGEIVFETTSPSEGWNGTHKGIELNRDVYVYYVEAICEIDGRSIIKTGDITLIR